MKTFLKDHQHLLMIGVLLFVSFVIYSPTLRHEFINWDDNTHIVDNPQIRSVSPQNVWNIMTSTVQKTYIPLTILSFAVEYHFVGLNPWLYYLNNILLHLLVVFLIFRLSLALGLGNSGSIIAAFIFSLHPMHVESVAWATERKDVLYSVFYLGAVLWYLRFLKTRKWLYYGLSLTMGFISMLAKPMALSLPLILLLCDWFLNGKFKNEDYFNKIPYFIFIIPLAAITFLMSANSLSQTVDSNLLLRFWAAAFYIKKFFWPFFLVPVYVPVLPANILHFQYWFAVLIVAGSVFVGIVWENRWFRFALLWYISSIFFLLNFDYPRFMQIVADRYMYLPSVGFCLFVGYVIERLWKENFLSVVAQNVIITVLIVAALALSIKTFSQISIWKDSFTFWNYTVKHSPESFVAYNNRGRIYVSREQYDLALADYQESVRINPTYSKVHKNLAMIYERTGDTKEAILEYTKAIESDSNYSGAYNNRGLLFEKEGKIPAALEDFSRAIASDPDYVLGYGNRGMLYVRLGEFDKGLADLSRAIKLAPNYPDAYSYRALCYLHMKLTDKARNDCQKVFKWQQVSANAYFNCSQVFYELGIYDMSLMSAERARKAGYKIDEKFIDDLKMKLVQDLQRSIDDK
ncbi:MAG: tetratricopeptide repeat protein [Candidatus Omnitrophica bacterium]|nr:tetratricopeptide repeat protein [Candidatus Omnitrophota bacterium]